MFINYTIHPLIKNKLQVIYALNTQEVFNRKSALGSYILCLSQLLMKHDYMLRINELSLREVYTRPMDVKTKITFLQKYIPSFIKEFVKDIRLLGRYKEVYKIIDKQADFDSVLEFYTYGSDIGFNLSKKYKKPLILVYDSPVLEAHQFFNKGQIFFKRLIKKREKAAILKAKAIVVYSNSVKRYIEEKYQRSLPIHIHQNIDFTRFDYIENRSFGKVINICFIGSFLKWHRVDLLVNAFTRLRKERNDIKLLLLGNGMEYEMIQQLIQENEYASDIQLTGFVDGNRLLDYKKEIHIGVMPGSNWYGAPNKIFEYGASKMAVIAPDTPTIKDLFINEKEILLFENNSEDALFEALRYLCGNKNVIIDMARELQNKIKSNYSEQNTYNFYTNLIQNTCT